MTKKEYKSPDHKLINFFENSRDSWKERALQRQDTIRDLEAKVRDLEKSRDTWKTKAKAKSLSSDQEIKNSQRELKEAQKKIQELVEINKELKKKS